MTQRDNPPPRLLLDEMLSPRIASILRGRGVDAASILEESATRGADDLTVMQVALAEGRVLVTNNVRDFESLQRARTAFGEPFPPMIYTTDKSFPRTRNYVQTIADALERAVRNDLAAAHGGVAWLAPADNDENQS